MDYAQELRKLMELKGYTMYRLAKEMPCSQTAVKNWLSGSMPNPVMRARITEILGEFPEEKEIPASAEASGEDAEFLFKYHRASPRIQAIVRRILEDAESIDAVPGDDAKE